MSHKIKVLVANEYDPWFNLATEDWIFRDMDTSFHVLFLWRNADTVVIGRFQNPWTECNVDKMKEDSVKLARRQSGGGAVFHDLGNTNFTFMSSKDSYDKEINNQIIINALSKFNISAVASGRNDIVIETSEGERKISGSAFKETRDRCFHHGTLLINADLSRLANYLNPDKKKLEAKGVKSVRARVANLNDVNPEINHEALSKEIINEFSKHYEAECDVEYLDYEVLKSIPKLNEYYEKLKDWNWLYGETPKFNHRFDTRFVWGNMDVYLDSNKGLIEDIKIFSDSLHPPLIEALCETLKGKPYETSHVSDALIALKSERTEYEGEISDFSEWFLDNIK